MLVFLRHKLTFLATPKTGTTAVEMALKPRAEIVFSKSRKHITAARYANKIAPFLEDTFGVRPGLCRGDARTGGADQKLVQVPQSGSA